LPIRKIDLKAYNLPKTIKIRPEFTPAVKAHQWVVFEIQCAVAKQMECCLYLQYLNNNVNQPAGTSFA